MNEHTERRCFCIKPVLLNESVLTRCVGQISEANYSKRINLQWLNTKYSTRRTSYSYLHLKIVILTTNPEVVNFKQDQNMHQSDLEMSSHFLKPNDDLTKLSGDDKMLRRSF